MEKFKKAIIAIDFDGTITHYSPYPIMGHIREDAKVYIKKLYDKGYTLILWTSRDGDYLEEALRSLENENLLQYFKKIKQNTPRKLIADFYIDDRAITGKINWKKIYRYIIKNIPIIKQ